LPNARRPRPETSSTAIAAQLGISRAAAFFRRFLEREPDFALRVLTTKHSIVQRRWIVALRQLIQDEVDRGALHLALPIEDLAYVIARVCESCLYADIITGQEPDPGKVVQVLRSLLRD
jgi:hypothetical protein